MVRTLFRITLLWLMAVSFAAAQDDQQQAQKLQVAVRVAPPFVIEQDGKFSGLAIDLWEQIAAERGWRFDYQRVGLSELFDGVAEGRFDVGVGALTVTAAREKRVDFSHPFHSGGLGIAVNTASGSAAGMMLSRLFSRQFLAWVGGLCLLLGFIGVLAWLAERRTNPEQFGGRPLSGIGNGFWWAAVTMATVGYGDKAPVSLAGRLLGLVWMFTAIVLVATFTAGITASLTVGALNGHVQGPNDLPRVRVATVAGSTSEDWLVARGITARTDDRIESLLALAAEKKADALVYDAPILQYLINMHYSGQLEVLPSQLDRQNYAFALRPGNGEQRELINRSLLQALDDERWQVQLRRYLGRDD